MFGVILTIRPNLLHVARSQFSAVHAVLALLPYSAGGMKLSQNKAVKTFGEFLLEGLSDKELQGA
eukprot:2317169-Pyramimonas_sp.AAC.1